MAGLGGALDMGEVMDAPKRIWIDREHGEHAEDWTFYHKAGAGRVAYILVSEHARIVAEKDAEIARMRDALQWCSGSPDFHDGGQAREGWLKLCAPLLKGDAK